MKLLRVEDETATFVQWAEGVDRLVTSRIGVIELTRVARRIGGTEQALERVLDRLDVLPLTEPRLATAAELSPIGLRTLDAIHVASALSIVELTRQFACYDDRLATAASATGLEVVSPGRLESSL